MIKDDDGNFTDKLLSLVKNEKCQIEYLEPPSTYDIGKLSIRTKEQEVYLNHKLIKLTHYEFMTLHYSVLNKGQVLSREQIYEAVWSMEANSTLHSVTCVIKQLRSKLNDNAKKPIYIETVRGSGYKFILNKG